MANPFTHSQALRFIWSYARPQLPMLLSMLLCSLAGTAAMIAQPFFYKAALDAIASEAIPTKETAFFAGKMVLAGVATVFFMMTVEQLSNVLLGRVECKILRKVHLDAVAKAQRLSSNFHVNSFAGSTARKINRGTDSVETVLDRIWQNFFPATILTFGFFIVLIRIAPILSFVLTGGMLVYVGIAIWLNLIIRKYYIATDEQDSRVTGSLVDMLTGNSLVKAFAAETREDERHATVFNEWIRRMLRGWDISTAFVLIQFYYLVALEGVVLLTSVWLWYTGVFTAGSFLVVTFYIWQLWARLFEIGRNVRDYLKAMAHTEEMISIMQSDPGVNDAPNAKELTVSSGAIAFDKVGFRYERHSKQVFENFSLSIAPGEKIALVGHSGGGKSSFVKLLMRLYDVTSGSIVIDGQNIATVSQESLRTAVGLVPQDPILFHRTIRENITYGRTSATDEQVRHAAKLAHAAEFIETLPSGYDTLVGERGVKLSGGERQRVAIARAILADAPILVLDEATSSLDSLSEKYIQEALARLMEGRTTIVIAHRLSTIKKVDRIVVIEEGHIVEQGSHETLLEKENGVYRHFYELQSGGFLGED